MAAEERVLLSSSGHLRKVAWAPAFPPTSVAVAPTPPAEVPAESWPQPRLQRRGVGPSRLIALVEASPVGAERLAAALVRQGQASGRTAIGLSLEPRGRLLHVLPAGLALVVPEEALLDHLLELQRQADLLVVDLGCRWAPTLFRSVLSRADEIWLIGEVGLWGALEARQSQAEFSGWTDLDRVSLFALGPPGTGLKTGPGEPITLLESTEPSLTSFAESYWRRQSG